MTGFPVYLKVIFIICLIVILQRQVIAQPEFHVPDSIRIMFYNVENLFDTFDDPAVHDDEFTPESEKRWTYFRYHEKLNNIAKVIIAVGGWTPPGIIGLCEVENYQNLIDLTTKTPLKAFSYRIIHENSPDRRGIDVALLYNPENLMEISHDFVPVFRADSSRTRDILHAALLCSGKDTLHVFVNHWPSRVGGKAFSETDRINAAETLKSIIDSIFTINKNSKILIMGDFNDEPIDASLKKHLMANNDLEDISPGKIYNLSYAGFKAGKGTLTHKTIDNTWFMFDQFLISGSLLIGSGLKVKGSKCNIFAPRWLIKNERPFRTYRGPIYIAGFSDHLPIFLDLRVEK